MAGTDEPDNQPLTEPRRGMADRRHADQDRTLVAMQQLEAALAAAAPRREPAWLAEVRRTLTVLGEAAAEEACNAAEPDSLLSDIARTQPWLRNRVRGLRLHYGQLRDRISALQHELGEQRGQDVDFADIRQRLAWVLAGLRHQQARESDLIYEAYYDAFHADLRPGAGQPPGDSPLPLRPSGNLQQPLSQQQGTGRSMDAGRPPRPAAGYR